MRKKLFLSLALIVGCMGGNAAIEENHKAVFTNQLLPVLAHQFDSNQKRGPRGPRGDRGPPGIQGIPGGTIGPTGSAGPNGATGALGVASTNVFSSVTVATKLFQRVKGQIIRFPALSSVFFQGGGLNARVSGVVVVPVPGYYRVNYGISTVRPGQVFLVVDGNGIDVDTNEKGVPGTSLSTVSRDQMASQSVIVHVTENFYLRTPRGLVLEGNFPAQDNFPSTTYFLAATLLVADSDL